MFMVIPNWTVRVTFTDESKDDIEFTVSETHIQNVYGVLQKLDFGRDVEGVTIGAEPKENQQVGVSISGVTA